MVTELAVLAAAGSAVSAGAVVLTRRFSARRMARSGAEPIQWPPTWEEYLAQHPELLPRKRHNLHCPMCGRFSKRIPDMPNEFMECRHHGLVVRAAINKEYNTNEASQADHHEQRSRHLGQRGGDRIHGGAGGRGTLQPHRSLGAFEEDDSDQHEVRRLR